MQGDENVDPRPPTLMKPPTKLQPPTQMRKSLEERTNGARAATTTSMGPPSLAKPRANSKPGSGGKSRYAQNGLTDPMGYRRRQDARPHSAQGIRNDASLTESQVEDRAASIQGYLSKSESERIHSLTSEINRLKTEKYEWDLEKQKVHDELEDCKKENATDRQQFRDQESKLREKIDEKELRLEERNTVIAAKDQEILSLTKQRFEEVGQAREEKAALKEQWEREFKHHLQELYNREWQQLHGEMDAEKQRLDQLFDQEIKQLQITQQAEKKRYQEEVETQAKRTRGLEQQLAESAEQLESERHETATLRKALAEVSASSTSIESVAKSQQDQIDELRYQLDAQKHKATEARNLCQLAEEECQVAKSKLLKEEIMRRKLHNQVQELKGNIRVFCRVRPKLDNETGEPAAIEFPDVDDEGQQVVLSEQITTATGNAQQKMLPFQFDKVFDPSATNPQIFDEISQLVQSALDGYNVCIFAYGQTGSGKTHTMSAEDDGMIPRAVNQIFQTAETMKERGWEYQLEGQFLEIYNENLNDLLGKPDNLDNTKLEIRHDQKEQTTRVVDLTAVGLKSPEQVHQLLHRASKNRSVAATKMNERSSRSHSVFMLHIKGQNVVTGKSLHGTLNLIDLAGSERLAQSQVTGDRLKETQSINKSLSALGDVIYSLGSGDKQHVPYRNSKLTYLLQYSLSGSSKTLMFVNVSPLEPHVSETISSLRFATKVNNTKIKK